MCSLRSSKVFIDPSFYKSLTLVLVCFSFTCSRHYPPPAIPAPIIDIHRPSTNGGLRAVQAWCWDVRSMHAQDFITCSVHLELLSLIPHSNASPSLLSAISLKHSGEKSFSLQTSLRSALQVFQQTRSELRRVKKVIKKCFYLLIQKVKTMW